jgi:hypothetical protein
MAQPRSFDVDPKGSTRSGVDRGHSNRGILPARPVGHQRFERLPIGKFPGAGKRQDVPLAQRLDQRHIGLRGLGGIGSDHDLLAPDRPSAFVEHLPKQGIFGLVVGIILAPDHGEIYRETIDMPWRHEPDDPEAKDIGIVLAQTGSLGHWMLGPTCALQGTVAHQRQEAVLGWGPSLQGLVGEPLQQGLRAPVGGAQQAPVVLVGQGGWPMPSQRLQMGPFAIKDVAYEQPTADQLVPVANARSQHPQAL